LVVWWVIVKLSVTNTTINRKSNNTLSSTLFLYLYFTDNYLYYHNTILFLFFIEQYKKEDKISYTDSNIQL
jgi:hypothetical protein